MVVYLLLFYLNANWTDKTRFCVKILLYFSHADEASEAN